jgi:SAM-dependent methyltransferase
MARSGSVMFDELAPYYDEWLARKPYRGEGARLVSVARRYLRSTGRAWLDVGCGTGRHLDYLRATFEVAGVDASRRMLAIARRRLPGVPLRIGDMRTFDLHRKFDVVTCLFGALGHLPTERDVRLAIANFARHLRPGGVCIVEPWIQPSAFREGMVHVMERRTRGKVLIRLAYSRRRERQSEIECHYLVAATGVGVRHIQEVNRGALLSRGELARAARAAGLRPTFLARGLIGGRGLLVGVLPLGRRAAGEGISPSATAVEDVRPRTEPGHAGWGANTTCGAPRTGSVETRCAGNLGRTPRTTSPTSFR